jgi:hypothetical protein
MRARPHPRQRPKSGAERTSALYTLAALRHVIPSPLGQNLPASRQSWQYPQSCAQVCKTLSGAHSSPLPTDQKKPHFQLRTEAAIVRLGI